VHFELVEREQKGLGAGHQRVGVRGATYCHVMLGSVCSPEQGPYEAQRAETGSNKKVVPPKHQSPHPTSAAYSKRA
jgi:hypothetical protein